jgi:hypothetical protein
MRVPSEAESRNRSGHVRGPYQEFYWKKKTPETYILSENWMCYSVSRFGMIVRLLVVCLSELMDGTESDGQCSDAKCD